LNLKNHWIPIIFLTSFDSDILDNTFDLHQQWHHLLFRELSILLFLNCPFPVPYHRWPGRWVRPRSSLCCRAPARPRSRPSGTSPTRSPSGTRISNYTLRNRSSARRDGIGRFYHRLLRKGPQDASFHFPFLFFC